MITENVKKALAAAKKEGNNSAALLQMLTVQFSAAEHSRKSGEGLSDDKAAVIIKRIIEGIKRDGDLSNTDPDITNRKVQLLESFL